MPDPPATNRIRVSLGGSPNEPATDGSAKLDFLAGAHSGEIGRDLSVGDLLHGELDALTVGRSAQRIAALRAVPVLGGQLEINVLTGQVAAPTRHGKPDRLRRRGLGFRVHHTRNPPLQLRCQTIVHGSIPGVALFSPRVTVVVIAQTLPESGYIAVAQLDGSHPLRGLPKVQVRHQQPRRAAVDCG